jgi:hypothetical protein
MTIDATRTGSKGNHTQAVSRNSSIGEVAATVMLSMGSIEMCTGEIDRLTMRTATRTSTASTRLTPPSPPIAVLATSESSTSEDANVEAGVGLGEDLGEHLGPGVRRGIAHAESPTLTRGAFSFQKQFAGHVKFQAFIIVVCAFNEPSQSLSQSNLRLVFSNLRRPRDTLSDDISNP